MSRLTRDGTAEAVSGNQILRRERGQGNIGFPCSADHVQDYWQPYPVDPYSCYMCDHTYSLYCCSISLNIRSKKIKNKVVDDYIDTSSCTRLYEQITWTLLLLLSSH